MAVGGGSVGVNDGRGRGRGRGKKTKSLFLHDKDYTMDMKKLMNEEITHKNSVVK